MFPVFRSRVHPAPAAAAPPADAPASLPLSQLPAGVRARVTGGTLGEGEQALLRAMGLRPDAEVELCRGGQRCIVSVVHGCGGGCRIGLARELADGIVVTPKI